MNTRNTIFSKSLIALAISAALATAPAQATKSHDKHPNPHELNKKYSNYYKAENKQSLFKRIASFPAFENYDIDTESVAEIVAASKDGMTLLYTDSENESLGLVDITDPAKPVALGSIALGGEPTSVAVAGRYALVAVNTSPDFVSPSGHLNVIDIETRSIVKTFDLQGQPDSVAVSPDQKFAAIAIENERNEEWCVVPGEGLANDFPVPEDDEIAETACDVASGTVSGLPQQPAGKLVVMRLDGSPAQWKLDDVSLSGLDGMLYADDPEPEYVDINKNNIAVVTLQENNHIVLVDLAKRKIIKHFSAGKTDLVQIDTVEDELISLDSELFDVPREPDGVSWLNQNTFATADEGDLDGGSRGFTIYKKNGKLAYISGNSVEHVVVKHGHFPEDRAENKGNEPENVEYAKYGKDKILFVGSERASVVLVYRLKHQSGKTPELLQVLPTLVKPEGLLAIPQRGLFVVASEEDDRGDKIRAGLTIFKRAAQANYPSIVSANRTDGTPIPWSALSGLALDQEDDDKAYTVQDSFYKQSRILSMDIDKSPALINDEIILKDSNGLIPTMPLDVVNDDDTVNLDLEGITTRADGGFWVVSEGRGTINDTDRPFETLNLLLKVDDDGTITQVVTLPDSVNARQLRFGFEGVTTVGSGDDEKVYVAFQREWAGDPARHVRIGRYDTASSQWAFYYYPIDERESANGGWVGLSDIAHLGDERFAVIERDNQAGPDAAIKKIYQFSLAGLTPASDSETPNFALIDKSLASDLMPKLKATGGLVLEKIEGLMVNEEGDAWIVNDNDGVDDSNGETQLIKLDSLFD